MATALLERTFTVVKVAFTPSTVKVRFTSGVQLWTM